MSATPEREQAEALDVLRDCYEQAVRKNWDSVNLATYDLRRALAAVSRLEAERDALRAEKGEAEEWLGEYGAGGTPAGLIGGIHNLAHRAEKAEAQLAAAVERAEKAERRANHHCEEYDLIRAEASRKNEAAVERERELTRAIEATFVAVREHGFCPVCGGNREDGHAHDCKLAEAFSGEALAGGVSAAGRPPEQWAQENEDGSFSVRPVGDLGGGTAAVAQVRECIRKDIEWYETFGDEHSSLVQTLRDADAALTAAGRPPDQDLGGNAVARAQEVPDAPWEFVQDDIDLRLGRARVFTARNHLVCETTPEYADVIVCAVGFMLNAGGGTAAVAEAGDDGR